MPPWRRMQLRISQSDREHKKGIVREQRQRSGKAEAKGKDDMETSKQNGTFFYRPPEAWFGDAIPFCDNGIFYIYYLYDERKTPVTADHTSWHLVSTRDFIHWEEQGEVLPAGGNTRDRGL